MVLNHSSDYFISTIALQTIVLLLGFFPRNKLNQIDLVTSWKDLRASAAGFISDISELTKCP